MPALKRFANLEFFQDVQIKYLKPILKPHSTALKECGVKVSELEDSDEAARLLFKAFTEAPDQLPAALLADLHTVEELATETGHDRLVEEAREAGLPLPRGEISRGDLALHCLHSQRDLAERCFATTVDAQVNRFAEYATRKGKRLDLEKAMTLVAPLERALGSHFEQRGFSKACFIHVYEEQGEIFFHITHGRSYRSTGTIVEKPGKVSRSRTAFREQKYDVVVYSNRDHVLRIHTTFAKETEKYRSEFGKQICGDAAAFDASIPIYDLGPLRSGRKSIAATRGIQSVVLKEVWCHWRDPESTQRTRSSDVFRLLEGERAKLDGDVVRAMFSVTYASGGKPRRLEIQVPRQAIFDRAHSQETLEFLRTHRFLCVRS